MNDFDQIMANANSNTTKSNKSFDKNTWRERKQQERQEVYDLMDKTADEIKTDINKYKQYLDVQGRFDKYSVGNALVISATYPNATQIKEFDDWKESGVFIVLKQIKSQKGIRVELLESKSGMDGTIVELINGIEVIRICDSLDFETKRFDDKGEFLRAKEMKHHKAMAMYDCLKFINQAVFTVLVIGISTYLATKNIISVGAVLTAYLCFNQLLRPLEELHRIFDEVSECTVLATDFFKMVEIENDFSYLPIKTKSENKSTNEIINMENITFHYSENEDKIILDNFNIDIEKGMYLGIAGPSGCGKSSLIKSICKLEKAEGKIIVDDKNIDNLTRKDLSKLIALVPQSPFLIAGTIFENITYGIDREVSIDEVEEAAKRAYIYDYINGLPDKFDSLVSEGGNNLSGGQRQRISIARIFLRKPKILILDEATSALDNTSEKYIQAEIEKMKKENNTTIIAIAHRLTTLKNCDRIIVLNKGKIEEDGKFDDLIEKMECLAICIMEN